MNIGFDAKRAMMNSTGLGVYSRNLLNALLQYYPKELYHLFAPQVDEFHLAQIRGVYQVHSPQGFLNQAFPSFWRTKGIVGEISQYKLDVFHGLSNEIPMFGREHKSIKKVVTIHDLIFLKEKQQYPFIDRQIYNAKVKYACAHADVIVATSEQTKADIVERYSVQENKIKVVYQNCDSRFFQRALPEERINIRERYGLPQQFVLNVSSFYPRKNQALLIQAFASICKQTDHSLVLIGGMESERKKCEHMVSQLCIQDRVLFLSNIPAQDLPLVYQCADLFVCPSAYEGFGIPIVEALASGVPVLCSNIPCFKEVGAEDAIYFDLLSSDQLAKEMLATLQKQKPVDLAIRTATRFSAELFAAQMISVYRA